ncbi:hypothetical protein QQF64_005874 [Cirrhinus molitorella]|uniref:Uncharacterized protein n=1 Tax=Cirrhinus molitorella TaxID=172907 RepID=A0ABR3MDI5_9TELE
MTVISLPQDTQTLTDKCQGAGGNYSVRGVFSRARGHPASPQSSARRSSRSSKVTGSRPVMRSARQSHVRVCKYTISPLLSRLNRSVERWSWPPHAETEMESDRTGVMRSGERSDDA